MITLGGSCPCLLGVPDPPALGEPPPMALNRSGVFVALCPGFKELIEPDCGCEAGLLVDALRDPPSFGGKGLFRGSFRAVVEEEGVATGD